MMNIRAAMNTDVEGIVHLFEQLGYPTVPKQLERQLHLLHEHALGQAFIAHQAGNAVGVAVVHLMHPLHVDASWALLSALVVDDACRGAGVGAHLLAAAESFALQHGCSQLELSSSSARTRAHAFYERNGYKEKRMRFVKRLL